LIRDQRSTLVDPRSTLVYTTFMFYLLCCRVKKCSQSWFERKLFAECFNKEICFGCYWSEFWGKMAGRLFEEKVKWYITLPMLPADIW